MPNLNVGLSAAWADCQISRNQEIQNITILVPTVLTGTFEQTCTGQTDTMGVFTTTFCPEVKVFSICGPEYKESLMPDIPYISGMVGFKTNNAIGRYCYVRIVTMDNYENNNTTMISKTPIEQAVWGLVRPDGLFCTSGIAPQPFDSSESCETNCQKMVQRALAQHDFISLINIFLKYNL